MWVGADPGGSANFGIAVILDNGKIECSSVRGAMRAIEYVKKYDKIPHGVGVDSPLWWCSGESSDRKADKWIRKVPEIGKGEVQTVNSLRGAVLAQGMLFVDLLRKEYGISLNVTEVHPKALLKTAYYALFEELINTFGVRPTFRSNHERDAIVSAIAAREGFSGRWKHDLSLDRFPEEQDPYSHWLAPIHYFWPGIE